MRVTDTVWVENPDAAQREQQKGELEVAAQRAATLETELSTLSQQLQDAASQKVELEQQKAQLEEKVRVAELGPSPWGLQPEAEGCWG